MRPPEAQDRRRRPSPSTSHTHSKPLYEPQYDAEKPRYDHGSSTDKTTESHSRPPANHDAQERQVRLREMHELQQTIANHERRLEDEKRKLNNIDRGICANGTVLLEV